LYHVAGFALSDLLTRDYRLPHDASVPNHDDLITVAEAAELLDTSVATIHRRIKSGNLPAAKKLPGLRGAVLLRRSDVEAVAA
jgi:excisionase family DNA binding protein